jgi:hypothetical protein
MTQVLVLSYLCTPGVRRSAERVSDRIITSFPRLQLKEREGRETKRSRQGEREATSGEREWDSASSIAMLAPAELSSATTPRGDNRAVVHSCRLSSATGGRAEGRAGENEREETSGPRSGNELEVQVGERGQEGLEAARASAVDHPSSLHQPLHQPLHNGPLHQASGPTSDARSRPSFWSPTRQSWHGPVRLSD